MLEARSVAVVGASPRQGSFGWQMLRQLVAGGFDGEILPVNPSYEEIDGRRCFSSLEAIGRSVDLAVLGVRNDRLEGQLRAAVAIGAPSAVIFASCYEEPRPGQASLPDRLADIAREAGVSLCGGNGMGFVNVERGLRACGYREPDDLRPGGIAFVTHSGSAFSAMLHNDRLLRFNVVVSSGNELATTTDQYVRYALERPSTRVIALFIETVRRPDAFREALRVAAERDVPVVALKVGREERARELVTAHSGALAGEDAAYDALFDAYGVLRVRSLDEMTDTLELFAAGRRAGSGGLASIHDSGGERAHLIDVAAEIGVPFAEISAGTTERLAATLEPGLPAVNPLDAWGTGNAADDIFERCISVLMDDAETAALAFCVDLTTEAEPSGGYVGVATRALAATGKPFAVMSNLSAAIDGNDARTLRQAGVPVLEGTRTGLSAFRHLFAYRDHRALPPAVVGDGPAVEIREGWAERFADTAMSEHQGLRLLADYGIPTVPSRTASTAETAVDAASELGWPVALKSAASGVAHKSDVRGVRLGLRDAAAVRAAYDDVARLGPEVVVQAMAPSGVELALGIVRDEQFGPLVLVAAGGTLIEVVRDRVLGLPPIDTARARRMLDRLAVRPLLDGMRGSPPADVDAVVHAITRVSVLAIELGDRLDALDVNPLIAAPTGAVAVDALVVPRIPATIPPRIMEVQR
jgi:acetate---CoA ligase (ADP-forming)